MSAANEQRAKDLLWGCFTNRRGMKGLLQAVTSALDEAEARGSISPPGALRVEIPRPSDETIVLAVASASAAGAPVELVTVVLSRALVEQVGDGLGPHLASVVQGVRNANKERPS